MIDDTLESNKKNYPISKWASNGYTKIELVFFERETEKFFYIGDVATKKQTTNWRHFDTRDEAKEYLIEQTKLRIAEYERAIVFERERLSYIEERYPNKE